MSLRARRTIFGLQPAKKIKFIPMVAMADSLHPACYKRISFHMVARKTDKLKRNRMPNFVNFPAKKCQSANGAIESAWRQWYRSDRQALFRVEEAIDTLGKAS
jgi:hypothetical protein